MSENVVSLVTIYRWEDADGIGPYQSGVFSTTEFDIFRHPPPGEDDAFEHLKYYWGYMDSSYLYGFESLQAMFDWFDEEMIFKMHEAGLELYRIEFQKDDVVFGEKQVMFKSNKEVRREVMTVDAMHVINYTE